MNALSSDSRLPLYQRLRDQLVEQIANNRWRPGEAIPTEAALSAEYQLSTGTVRKAVDSLVSEGILERQQGRGTFIRRPQFQSSLFRFFRFQTAAGERQVLHRQQCGQRERVERRANGVGTFVGGLDHGVGGAEPDLRTVDPRRRQRPGGTGRRLDHVERQAVQVGELDEAALTTRWVRTAVQNWSTVAAG